MFLKKKTYREIIMFLLVDQSLKFVYTYSLYMYKSLCSLVLPFSAATQKFERVVGLRIKA